MDEAVGCVFGLILFVVFVIAVSLNSYLFFSEKAVFFWSEHHKHPSGLGFDVEETHCHYYYPFGTKLKIHGRYKITACPRFVPLNG